MKKLFLATLVAIITVGMVASAASAQPGNGKALGHSKQPVCHNGKTLYLPAPAVVAHERHGDDAEECGEVRTPPEGPGDGDENGGGGSLIGLVGAIADGTLTFSEAQCSVEPGATLTITQEGTATVIKDGVNGVVIASPSRDLVVTGLPSTLTGSATITDSTGIVCDYVGVGNLSLNKSGDPVLKTTSGDTLKLKAKSSKGEKRLEALAKKSERVKVTGKKSGKALEVSQLKTMKGKKK